VTGSTVQAAGDRIIGCRPLSRFVQIDRLAMEAAGAGSGTTPPFRLPHGRYTVFAEYDPPTDVKSFAIVDGRGRGFPDWSSITASAGHVTAPLVQHELPRGSYRLAIETRTPSCAWRMQVILNSMMSWQAPPRPWRSALPPPAPILARSGESPVFQVARTGRYDIRWRIGEAQVSGLPIRRYQLEVRARDGHAIHLGRALTTPRDERISGAFLGAGSWTVEIKTDFSWDVLIAPVLGSTGGGSRGF
jgi:hypothetical protein